MTRLTRRDIESRSEFLSDEDRQRLRGLSPYEVELGRADTTMRLARSEACQAIRAIRSWRKAFAEGRYQNMPMQERADRFASLNGWLQSARKDHRRWRAYRDALLRGEEFELTKEAAE